MKKDLIIGVDFGTASVRSIIVDARTGEQKSFSVYEYPRWKTKKYCNAAKHQFRQHPLDYLEGLEHTLLDCLGQLPANYRKYIRAISVDTTGSTPIAVDIKGVPLAFYSDFEENPNAMFFLWKDHTALKEAKEINMCAAKFEIDYLKYSGGRYSSEWYWAKLLHALRVDDEIRKACYTWVEHCDWIPFVLTGCKNVDEMKRGICAAGHKALWSDEWGGFPPNEFFKAIDPLLDGFRDKLPGKVYTSDQSAGFLDNDWAAKLNLDTDVLVGIGALDAHVGAVGGEIEPYHLTKVMGTSTCDMLTIPKTEMGNKLVPGICGQVIGSILPNCVGLEAGQSAFGDVYEWLKNLLAWPLSLFVENQNEYLTDEFLAQLKGIEDGILLHLNREAAKIKPTKTSELAIEWLNGRRTPDANMLLKGAIRNLDLGTDAPRIYRSLVEATCFGAKSIVNRFVENGINIKGVIGIGGVAKKSPFIMQMMADILEMPIKVRKSEQTCALGAAMFAATVAGIYPDVVEAAKDMGQGLDRAYLPNKKYQDIYRSRYKAYQEWSVEIESGGKINSRTSTERIIIN